MKRSLFYAFPAHALALAFALAFAALPALPALAETPAFDPRSWRNQHAGEPTQVATLGSAHLGQLPVVVTAPMLAPLLDRLAAFNPSIITHEGISGEQCDLLRRYAVQYPNMFENYCFGTEAAARATGLDVSGAMAAVEKTLAIWPAQPTAGQRRQLAAYFLAAGDRPSAQVQWLRLPETERRAGDGIDGALLKILAREGAKPNETFDVAVALAARLGLERVYAVDDHTADSIQALAGPGFDPALQKIWASSTFPEGEEYDRRAKSIKDAADVLGMYRFTNAPAVQRAFIKGDYHWAMNTASPEKYGRQYVAWWETRNLRMVANIRAAFGNKPGARVLNIVGASHKPYYDAYLEMMSDVKLVDVGEMLK